MKNNILSGSAMLVVLVFLKVNTLLAMGTDKKGDALFVPVGDATIAKEVLYFTRPFIEGTGKYTRAEKNTIDELFFLLTNDFSFYHNIFEVIKSSNHGRLVDGKVDYEYWENKKVSYLIKSGVSKKADKIFFAIEMFDIRLRQVKYHRLATIRYSNVRSTGHKIAEEIYQAIVKKRSIFGSKIVFVSDRTSRKKEITKELYIMDFDGRNVKRLTSHRGIVVSPSISHDGSKVLYSVIKDIRKVKNRKKWRNIGLYMYNFKTKSSRLISNRRGMNSGAIFMPDGKNIILTLSYTGNTEIFIMNLKTRKTKRLTKHFAVDVDPSISRDGSIMTFLSDRPGKAMIYTLDPTGTEKDVKRISFVGRFNATPRFSPTGNEIAFSSWLDNRFDIFRINADGSGLFRLTKNFGSNEDPSYSRDGQFITFSSTRVISSKRAVQNIYIMDRNGEKIIPVTSKFGNCISPRWSR